MPFKSEAQRRKFGELLKQGKITQQQFDEYNSETKGKLPERVAPKQKKPKSLIRRKHSKV